MKILSTLICLLHTLNITESSHWGRHFVPWLRHHLEYSILYWRPWFLSSYCTSDFNFLLLCIREAADDG